MNRKLEEAYTSGYTKDEKIIRIQESSGSNLVPLLILFFILLILILIIVILCCLYKSCPFHTYFFPHKPKNTTDRGTVVTSHIRGSGLGKESKSVQAVEWFNRKEAWTSDQPQEDISNKLKNHDHYRDSDDQMLYTNQNQRQNQEDIRDHLYIREGNTDILRLITREGTQQHTVPLAIDPNHTTVNSGKDMIMQHFINQQAERSEPISNTLTQLQTERELIQESLREQNALLRQLLIDRDLRLETQSLPACTQTDHDIGTQIEPQDFYPSQREFQSENEHSDVSDEEIAMVRERARKRNGRKSYIQKRIRTPIEEEVELRKSYGETSFEEKPMFKHTKTSELRQKRASSVKKLNETGSSKLGLRKEILQEISESLEHNRRGSNNFDSRGKINKQYSSSEDSGHSNNFNKFRYFSESDLTLLSSRLRPEYSSKQNVKSENITDSEIGNRPKVSKRKKQGISRYMEWYYNQPGKTKANKVVDSGETQMEHNMKSFPLEDNAYIRNVSGNHDQNGYMKDGKVNDSVIAFSKPPITNKKSVFTIAYDDVRTKQLRTDSTISE